MPERRLILLRHGERCDFVFNSRGISWVKKAFDANGRYRAFDVNIARTLPKRKDGYQSFELDPPLTEIGYLQSKLAGRAFREAGVEIDHIVCSPSLRCIQTTVGLLKGMGEDKRRLINIEPGLFEWLFWCRNNRPTWIDASDLKRHEGYPVNIEYEQIMKPDSLKLQETLADYYQRSFAITQAILRKFPAGNVLIVAHGASLDTCTRQLCGESARTNEEFYYLLHNTPYLACLEARSEGTHWKIEGSPIPTFTHTFNHAYDAEQLALPTHVVRQLIREREQEKYRLALAQVQKYQQSMGQTSLDSYAPIGALPVHDDDERPHFAPQQLPMGQQQLLQQFHIQQLQRLRQQQQPDDQPEQRRVLTLPS